MVFKRKVYDKLLEWKKLSAGASAVLLEGARRIGKSTIVEEFAKNEYDDYMILDLQERIKMCEIILLKIWMIWTAFFGICFC